MSEEKLCPCIPVHDFLFLRSVKGLDDGSVAKLISSRREGKNRALVHIRVSKNYSFYLDFVKVMAICD